MVSKRKHPKFLRPNYGRSKRSRIKPNWRRPRGIDNKKRLKIKYMGASPSIGYGQPKAIKSIHPSGLPEVLVQSPSEVKGLKDVAVRIASGVGRKKREEIERLCQQANLKVLNKKIPSKKSPAGKQEAEEGKQEQKIGA
ncbi:MAG: eL32 family ribosomal protein [Candidatus Micrarchaeota archaeon]|nr:eL32 family ribosomal protein [Candidatus Micrarchaeota archaeon]